MKKTKINRTKHLKGIIAPPDNSFYYHWALEFPKENIQTINEHLNRILTFSGVLFTGVIAFSGNLKKEISIIILIFLIICMSLSFLGTYPIDKKFNINEAATIKDSINKIITHKKRYMAASSLVIFIVMILMMFAIK